MVEVPHSVYNKGFRRNPSISLFNALKELQELLPDGRDAMTLIEAKKGEGSVRSMSRNHITEKEIVSEQINRVYFLLNRPQHIWRTPIVVYQLLSYYYLFLL